MTDNVNFEFDDILAKVGDFGRYQWIMYFVICLPATVPCAFSAFNQVFVAAVPKHTCKLGARTSADGTHRSMFNVSAELALNFTHRCKSAYDDSSQRSVELSDNGNMLQCIQYEYDRSTYDSTIVTEFDLVCENGHWPVISSTVFYVGSLLGNIIFGYMADKFGRRPAFFTILLIQVGFGTANSFAPNIYLFIVLRFIVGLTFPALYQIPFIIGMEMMGPSKRIFAGMVVCIIFGLSMCALGLVASMIRSWSTLTLLCNAPFVVLFSYWWILPESSRWLLAEGRVNEAYQQLIKIAKFNKKLVDPLEIKQDCELLYRLTCSSQNNNNNPSGSTSQHQLLNLIKTRNVRRRFIMISYIWFINAVVYNGLTFNISNLNVNDYLSFSINGLVEVPAYLLTWFCLDRVGRRWSLFAAMLIGGLACVSTTFLPADYLWTISSLAYVGKFGVAGSFGIIYIFATELYPTEVRAMGMGMSSMIAGIGLLVAPYLATLGNVARVFPMFIMGSFTISAGGLSLFLPETTGAPLLQNISEAEGFVSTRKLFSLHPTAASSAAAALLKIGDEAGLQYKVRPNQEPLLHRERGRAHDDDKTTAA